MFDAILAQNSPIEHAEERREGRLREIGAGHDLSRGARNVYGHLLGFDGAPTH